MRQGTSRPARSPAGASRHPGMRCHLRCLAALVLLGALYPLLGCASKAYVRTQMAPDAGQRERLAGLDRRLEATAARVEELATEAAAHQELLEQATTSARLAAERAAEIERLATTPPAILLRSGAIAFDSGEATLDFEARELLDAFAVQLLARRQPVHIEIRGHIDRGEASALGEQRAESVARYLHLEHGIPLHRIDTLSLGTRRVGEDETAGALPGHNRLVSLLVLD